MEVIYCGLPISSPRIPTPPTPPLRPHTPRTHKQYSDHSFRFPISKYAYFDRCNMYTVYNNRACIYALYDNQIAHNWPDISRFHVIIKHYN